MPIYSANSSREPNWIGSSKNQDKKLYLGDMQTYTLSPLGDS